MDGKHPQYEPLPQYNPGIPAASRQEQGPLMKLMGKMISKKIRSPGKIAPQSVKIGHKKKQEKVTYW